MTCNRRVDESGFCAACSRAGKVAPRLNVRCQFADFESGAWLTTFHEPAEKVLSMKSEEVRSMEQSSDGKDKLEMALRSLYFSTPLQLTVRAKLDSYNGETRSNITCVDAQPVNFAEHGRRMLQEIQ